MRYLCLIYGDESELAGWGPDSEEWQTAMAEHGAFSEKAGAAGVLRGGEALQPSSTATTVQAKDGDVLTTDGPFAETKEQLGGYYIVETADLDEAISWASQIPHPHGRIEVRPIIEFD